MDKASKHARVDQLRSELSDKSGAVVVGHFGLTVAETEELRAEMRKVGGQVRVVKNTLARLAVQDTVLEPMNEFLTGSNIVAFGSDPVGPAKVVVKAAKDNDKLTIKGGVLDGKSLSVSEVEALSKLPGLEELRSKFLGVLQAVPSKLVRTLNEPARSFAAVLNARKEALESGEA